MNINFSNIGIGAGAFGIGGQPKIDVQKTEAQRPTAVGQDVSLSEAKSFDVLQGSEPLSDVPADALVRDDRLGRIVSSAFNLPPPQMPEFRS